VISHLGGGSGIHVLYIQTKIQSSGLDPGDVTIWSQTKDEVKEEFIAKYFLLKSDTKRYAGLTGLIQNDFISGQDMEPRTLSKAYDMIMNYVNPHKQGELTCRSRGCLSTRTMTMSTKDKGEVVESQGVGLDEVDVVGLVDIDAVAPLEHKQRTMRRTIIILKRSMDKL
jgi:hypothetical protein